MMQAPILVPLDGSATAERALPYAVQQAKQGDASLILVRAEPLPDYLMAVGAGVVSVTAEEYQRRSHAAREQAIEYLRNRAVELRNDGVAVQTHVALGHPLDVVLNAVREYSAQMIVMTTHGRTGPSRWFLGSVAEDVLRRSPVPVLVIRIPPPAK